MEFLRDAIFALAVWSVVLVIMVPILGVFLLTLLDALFRVDIGFSKLTWTALVLLLPVAGVLLYWILRPKRFNPLLEAHEPDVVHVYPAAYRPVGRPNLTLLQGGASQEAPAVDETTLPRAA